MLIVAIVLGLVLGLLSGGRITNLASIQLRWVGVLFAAVIVRFGTELLLDAGVGIVDTLRLPLLATGFGLLLAGLWANRSYPGMSLAFVGILLNGAVIVVNGGYMPIWSTALTVAGFTAADAATSIHIVLPGTAEDFLLRLLILGDIIPVPVPIIQNVASLGDVFLGLGLSFFLFAGVVRIASPVEAYEGAAGRGRFAGEGDSGLSPALTETASLERPMVMGGPGVGLASPALAALPATARAPAGDAAGVAVPRPTPEIAERIRRHPYVRLALNGSFSALWAGQLISLFGDRIHQIALAAVVLILTDSVIASSFVFVAATLPNVLLSPVAGTLVDRWDHKEVMVVSDLLRAALVLLIPLAVVTNVLLVYPIVFLMTTVSIFFRPARVAILPEIVREDELLSANSALWVGETMADIIGYPLAGLFVISLGTAIPVAFWLDAATYVGSAALLSTIVIRSTGSASAAMRSRGAGSQAVDGAIDSADEAADAGGAIDGVPAGVPAGLPGGGRSGDLGWDAAPEPAEGFFGELKAGWQFLRGEPTLLANTLQATVAQLTVGVLIALTPAFARTVFGEAGLGWEATYSFIETSQAFGSLLGGFLVGLIGSRFAKGRMIIGGYAMFGFLLFLFALTENLGLVLGFAFGSGIANMVWLIPSQTLFQERTPPTLMGRVVGFRFALVFGAMTGAMALGGLMGEVFGVTVVIAVSGLITMAAGLAGLLVPAVRDVR